MTQAVNQRLTKQGILEANRNDVIAALANNEPWSVIMPRYEVSKPAFAAFVKRHRAEIEALKQAVKARIEDVALKDKEARIRNYDRMIARIDALIEQRGGLEAVDVKWVGTAKFGREVDVRRFDGALVQQWLNLHDQIASELGDKPRPPDSAITVNVDNRRLVVFQNGSQE